MMDPSAWAKLGALGVLGILTWRLLELIGDVLRYFMTLPTP